MFLTIYRIILFVFLFLVLSLKYLVPVRAFCPVCTVAVGAGVGLSRWLGIDDTITGLWVGALTTSMIAWTISWLASKNKTFPYYKLIMAFIYYSFIVFPLALTDIIGHPLNRIWGIDKLLLGMILGSLVFYGGGYLYQILKIKNNGHAHFPFEKVVMPITPVIILSMLFYFLTK
jgi:hypothetical protein